MLYNFFSAIGVGSWRWLTPPTPQFCVGYTNMLVSKNVKICVTPDAKPKICVSPSAKPQRKSVEYRLHWVPNANFSRWACTLIFVFWVSFSFTLGTPFPVEYGLYSFKRSISKVEHCVSLGNYMLLVGPELVRKIII